MKLRYQMRGLGIGMFVTALLMGIATGEKIPLSDAEIRAKALELGMVESDSLRLTDLQNAQPSSEPAGSQPPGDEALPSGSGGGQEDAEGSGTAPEGEESPEGGRGQEDSEESGTAPEGEEPSGSGRGQEGTGESGTAPEGEESPESGIGPGGQENPSEPGSDPEGDRRITVVIEAGMDSYSISKMLAESGLVEDASEFDEYIYGLGYSRYIQAGTYEIFQGTDMEEIAKIITGNR